MQKTPKNLPAPNKPLWMAYVLGIIGVTAFGATLPVTRISLESYTPEYITFARALIATCLAAMTLFAFQKPFFSGNLKLIFFSGMFLVFTFPGFMAIAMQTVPASHGGVVLGFLPLATAIVARIIAEEKPSPRFWVLSVAGCAIVTAYILVKSGIGIDGANLAGYAWLVVAGLTAAIGYVIFGKLSRTTPGWEVICRALIYTFPVTLIGLILFWNPAPFDASFPALISLFYLGAFSMFLAFCAWNVALAWGGIARMGQLQLLQIFVTIVIAVLLLGETLDTFTIGAAVLVTAIIAASRNN